MTRLTSGFLLFLFLVLPASVFASEVTWQVLHPFRFINSKEEANRFSIPADQPALEFIKQRMSQRDTSLLPPYNATYWDRDPEADRRLSESYIFPTSHSVEVSLTNPVDGQCLFRYQSHTEKQACSEPFKFEAITQFGEGDPTLKIELISIGQTLTETILVKDRLILGLGDSFASGEGNPDNPAVVSASGTQQLANENSNIYTTGRWMKHEEKWLEKDAQWLDKQCHRSFFSQHIMAALKLASSNPHETVTVVPLACSGAEILDGILIPQEKPPGGGDHVKESQVNFAVKHLCRNGSVRSVTKAFYRGYTGQSNRALKRQPMYRCDGELRKPDAILLSIGGNDVGFAPSLTWATVPSGYRNPAGLLAVKLTHKVVKPVCPKDTGQRVCRSHFPVGKDRIKYWLPDYYTWLAEQLVQTGLVEDPSKVFLTAYPNPSFIEDGQTYCDNDRSSDANEQARTKLLRLFRTQVWQLGITKSEMEALNTGLIDPLYAEMKRSSELHNWTFIDGYIDDLNDKGICAGHAREDKNIPIYPHIRRGSWYPEDPADQWAYDVNRARWYRTTNDSWLFQGDNTDGDMNGAFHPDFRTHSTIADHVANTISSTW